MAMNDSWWKVILDVADELDKNNIFYTFDASTAVFVHGIDFTMDDLDIMIQWNCFEAAHELFARYRPKEIRLSKGWWQFYFYVDGLRVHMMSSEQIKNMSEDSERIVIRKGESEIWAKFTGDTLMKTIIWHN